MWNPFARLPTRMRLLAAAVLAVLLLAAVAVPVVLHLRHRTALQQALALAPGNAQRYLFTDWSRITRAHDPSQTEASPIADLARQMSRSFGFSPSDLEWELSVGSPETADRGQVDLLRLPDSFDVAALSGTLRGLGYRAPTTPTGVWDGIDATTDKDSSLFAAVALDPADHLIRLSDSATYLSQLVDSSGTPLPGPLADAARALGGDTVSAQVWTGSYLCRALALGTMDDDTATEGQQLVAQAGPINPVLGVGFAETGSGDVLTAMAFADHDQAKANADARSRLAVGPAVGQNDGSFTSMFHLGRVEADGDVVTMDLQPREPQLYADLLSGGPILFATC